MSSSSSSPTVSSAETPVRGAYGGPLSVLAAAALWGTTGTTATFAPPAASPLAVGAATMGIGGLITFLLAGRRVLRLLADRRRAVLVPALLGGAGVAVYPLAFYTSMSFAGVATGTVVSIGCSPVFAAVLERLLDGARLTRRWAVATTAAAAGCGVLVALGDAGGTTGPARPAAGVLLALLAGAAYAAFSYCAARIIRGGHGSGAAMGAVFGLGSCVLLPVLAVTGGPLLVSRSGLAVTAYLALVPMAAAYLLFGAGLRRVAVSTATTLSLFEPVVAAALGVLVVHERLGGWAWTGVGLVVSGLAVLTVRGPRRGGGGRIADGGRAR